MSKSFPWSFLKLLETIYPKFLGTLTAGNYNSYNSFLNGLVLKPAAANPPIFDVVFGVTSSIFCIGLMPGELEAFEILISMFSSSSSKFSS